MSGVEGRADGEHGRLPTIYVAIAPNFRLRFRRGPAIARSPKAATRRAFLFLNRPSTPFYCEFDIPARHVHSTLY